MTPSLVVYALWISALLAAGAWLAERLLRSAGAPTRFAWLGAMFGTVALSAAVPLRQALQGPAPFLDVPIATSGPVGAPEGASFSEVVSVLDRLPLAVRVAIEAECLHYYRPDRRMNHWLPLFH